MIVSFSQIDKANEFDLIFTCKVECEVDFTQHESGDGYVALKANTTEMPKKFIYRNEWISPYQFSEYFKDTINRSLGKRQRRELAENISKYHVNIP